jgi:hypothetical protein
LRHGGEAGSVAGIAAVARRRIANVHMTTLFKLFDEAMIAVLATAALMVVPNRQPAVVFIIVFAAGALFDFVLRQFIRI